MEVDVCYPSWLIGDADGGGAISVGSRWTTTLLLEPIYPRPPEVTVSGVSHPSLELIPSPERSLTLHPLEGEPGGYEFVADATMGGVLLREERRSWLRTVPVHLPCGVLTVAGIRFAVVEACQGRVGGLGRLWHDTYMLDDESVRSAATQEFTVTRIRFLEHVYQRAGDGEFVLADYRAPVDVDTTHAWLRSPPSGEFLITVDTSTTRQVTADAEAARLSVDADRGLWGWLRARVRRARGRAMRP